MGTVPKHAKGINRKAIVETLWTDVGCVVKRGRLVPRRGRPHKPSHLFRYVAEKLPFGPLSYVHRYMKENADHLEGVYIAHDSMGVARYGGRGAIFTRLASHKKNYSKELLYYSFYIIENKAHEREIETALLRASGPQMVLNTKRIASGLNPGNIGDYEPDTEFFERQNVRGRKTRRKIKN